MKKIIAEELFLRDQKDIFKHKNYNWFTLPFHLKLKYEVEAERFIEIAKQVKRRIKT